MYLAHLLQVEREGGLRQGSGMMDRLLICGTNWLGDSIMSMPAIQSFRRHAPATHITLLIKPGIASLWEMHAAIDAILPIQQGRGGTGRTVRALKQQSFDCAVLFPNSFRSALLPFLGGVPRRIGVSAHWRRLLLTETRGGRNGNDRAHQACEYYRLLNLAFPRAFPAPQVVPPAAAQIQAEVLLDAIDRRPWVGLLPGAARGDAKRWPADSFAEVAQRLVEEQGVRVAIFGTDAERPVGDAIAAAVGAAATNLAGETVLTVLAACLARCRAVVSNDNGGMHLATALGVPVVAIFGRTDPDRTGPLGTGHRVICGAPRADRTRDIPRKSAAAEAALRRVSPEQVLAEVCATLESL